MRKLLNPKWLFLSNTLPLAILLFLEWSEFKIIKSLLSETNITLWHTFATALIMLMVCNAAYALIQIRRKKRLDLIYCIVSLIAYISYIYLYYYNSDGIIPFSIPDWMISGNIFMYVGSFLMPTLIHSLFATVVILTPDAKNEKAWQNILLAVLTPMIFYAFGVVISSLWNGSSSIGSDMFVLLVVLLTAIFLFFILRFIYILISKRKLREYRLMWKIPIALVMPLIGLTINTLFDNMFGDFSGIWFYIITFANAILLCIPNPEDGKLRLLMFFGRWITFIYTLYFFIIFLPFLPFSMFAIILAGLGFLMLTPLMLFPIHLNELVNDFGFLKRIYKKRTIYLTALAGLLVLPAGTTVSYLYDRVMLNKTLEYIYSPDYSKEYKLSANAVNKMLSTIDHRAKGRDMYFYRSTPFLSSYYKWLVMDNMNLSQSKKDMMRDLFNGSSYDNSRDRTSVRRGTTDIKITDIGHHSEYDTDKKAWISWIDLTIKNGDTPLWNAEYKTYINLPEGCWISDYYLYVGDVKEPGILAEKKAATWVFDQIRSVNRDPGLLRYLHGNLVEFKVFPFQKEEIRRTGIEFIHKDPVEITIDGYTLSLGNSIIQQQVSNNSTVKTEDVIYLSTTDKNKLETVERKPYYHFIVDVSANWNDPNQTWYEYNHRWSPKGLSDQIKESRQAKYAKAINNLFDKHLIDTRKEDARISYTNTYIKEENLSPDLGKSISKQVFEGGFFLDRAIKKILFDAYTNPTNAYPVIVVVSDNIDKGIVNQGLGDLKFTYPESDYFYSIGNDSLRSHSFESGTKVVCDNIDSIPLHTVKAWPNPANPAVYLPDDNKPSIILANKDKSIAVIHNDIKEKDWISGLRMQAQWMSQVLHPQTADREWLSLIQNSFKSRIMTPLTSYIVVENEAQKAILEKKQEEALSGNRSLDLTDETQRMSEPDLIIIAFLFGLFILYYKQRKKRCKVT
ncbi:MSEP-CTERM sorting domain-containing protein [Dysgonomonas sp. 521]|uniref:MSEP-CTERM sorting domain-containing protein n=1 Tax=Dysgonomonas sp. 521 TaxID=2302932 RepID=UPI0013CF53B1|nr:MSEP-CTERM sorting domain-containing protein [Dysgonomonas sp. 521]NDV96859.1 MSEP-CTERM sorting domain-containing protein [Dysgonomonas sp. 521]